ncbi:hypothetical protein AAMO2058_000333500 [Amorphochlora amoebiformis]
MASGPESTPKLVTREAVPGKIKGHLAAFAANSCFGMGSVIVGLALGNISPMLFSTLRSGLTGFVFLLLSGFHLKGVSKGLVRILGLGMAMFCAQAFYTIALKSSSAVMAAIWQPTQPIFTLVIATALGMEKPSSMKVLGILIAFAGCAYIVIAKPKSEISSDNGSPDIPWWVNLLFIIACIGSSCMTLSMKSLTNIPTFVANGTAAWVCCGFLVATTLTLHSYPDTHQLLCPGNSCGNGWKIPDGFAYVLAFVVIVMTVTPYYLNSIAAKHIDGSLISAYTAVQPVIAALTSVAVKTLYPDTNLELPHVSALFGVGGIFLGLAIVVSAAKSPESQRLKQD